ncbi:IclR family transcriptional regulator [Prauserella cavernicola]|uniref:IclR family transcriptional regulator n=1 Tax=Prauserella cavernicola TaxID=2800127 RepID=A0A934R157_9PSEU|nr:IclR family transcriptional regulator [Prauserella cavernicola]MBK1789184.1 IclR family transcriptional regulator [Prauserella cavernicola]
MTSQYITGQDGGTGTEAAGRVADVLLQFAGGPAQLGVSEISRNLGLSKAVVYRILQSLVSRHMLTAGTRTGGYRLGPAAVAIGATALSRFDARAAARPVLRRLRDETGETTTLSSLVGDQRVYVEQFESPREIKMTVEIGRRFPLHAGASGKVILAHLSAEAREAVLAGPLPSLTERTVHTEGQLRQELADIAAAGVAVTVGERQSGSGSVAAPLFGPDESVCGAISVCGPDYRFTDAECGRYQELVTTAADEISRSESWLGETHAARRKG